MYKKEEKKNGLPALMAAWSSVVLEKRDERLTWIPNWDSDKYSVKRSAARLGKVGSLQQQEELSLQSMPSSSVQLLNLIISFRIACHRLSSL